MVAQNVDEIDGRRKKTNLSFFLFALRDKERKKEHITPLNGLLFQVKYVCEQSSNS
jgi:hypothetical protein